MKVSLEPGRPPLHVVKRGEYLQIAQDRAVIKLTAAEAVRVADELIDLQERCGL